MNPLRLIKRERALQGLDVAHMRGVEIGPLSRPLILKDESDVYYVDHCSADDLRAKYLGDPNVDPDEIVNVDFIWSDQPTNSLLHDICPLDYVVASHVIEHVPDLIGWLQEMHDVLHDGGSLVLIVPDKRFTFDVHRRVSSLEEIRLAHAERRRRPGIRCVMDHFANVVRVDTWALWDDYSTVQDLPFFHGPSLLNHAAIHHAEGRYVDVHCWVFTPWSFLSTIGRIVSETGLGFDLQYFRTTSFHDLEFYVRLTRVPKSTTDWEAQAASARENASWPEKMGQATELADGQTGEPASRIDALDDLAGKLAQASRGAELAEARSAQLTSRIEALENSTSWRVTAPMRALARIWRG